MLRRSGGAGQQRRGGTLRASTRRRRCTRGDAGETLLELLVTSAILGFAVVAVVGGVYTSVTVSDHHREQTSAVTVLRSYAEALKSPDGAYAYRPCDAPVPADRPPYPTFTPPAPHTTYQTSVVSIEYLVDADAASPSWSGSCPGAGDQGLQRLTLRVESPAGTPRGANEEMVVVKRDARCDLGSTYPSC